MERTSTTTHAVASRHEWAAAANRAARLHGAGAGANLGRMGPHVHLNMNVRGLEMSATVAINELSAELIRQGRTISRLGLGQSPFPVPGTVVDALRANAAQKAYLAVRGLQELRESIADYHQRRNGVPVAADDVLVGPGSKELMFVLQIVFYGELVIPTPAWVSYAPQAQIVGRRVAFVECDRSDGWMLTPEKFEALCKSDPDRPRVIVLNYPSNPTGGTLSAEQLAGLAAVARRYGCLVLSDEIYGELHHAGEHVSIARFYPEGTILSSGLSKWCGAGGWRLGTFTFPKGLRWLLDAMAAVASETYTTTSAPIQYAAVHAFRGGMRIERYLALARKILAALGAACRKRLLAEGVDVLEPQGGFYLFPDFRAHAERLHARGVATSADFARRLLNEAGVAVLPGSDFGRSREELTLRLAYVDFDGAKALASLEAKPLDYAIDEHFLQVHCHSVLSGVERLCAWLRGEKATVATSAPQESRA